MVVWLHFSAIYLQFFKVSTCSKIKLGFINIKLNVQQFIFRQKKEAFQPALDVLLAKEIVCWSLVLEVRQVGWIGRCGKGHQTKICLRTPKTIWVQCPKSKESCLNIKHSIPPFQTPKNSKPGWNRFARCCPQIPVWSLTMQATIADL